MQRQLSTAISAFAVVLLVATTLCDDQENLDYIVEVLAVVDTRMFEKWNRTAGVGSEENVLAEVKSLFYEVNIVYQSLRMYNLSVEIRLKDVVFPTVPIIPDSAVKNKTVWERQVSSFFNTWLRANRQYTYDHAMIITNHKMKGSTRVTGVARLSATCRNDGTSRVMGRLDYATVLTAAHELGHSLGSSHDNNKKQPCLKGYVMSPSGWEGSLNRFYFSPCSAKSIRWYITKRLKSNNNCLLKTTCSPIVSKRMGEFFDHKQMCQRLGRWVSSAGKGDAVCKKVQCRDRWKGSFYAPPEGIACGNGKHCFMGYCV